MTRREALDNLEAHIKAHVAIRYRGDKKTEQAYLYGIFKGIAYMSGDDEFIVRVCEGIKDQYPLD